MFWSRPIVSDKINISPGSVGRPPHWHYPGSSSRSPAAGCPPRYRGGWCPPEWWRWWPDSRRECEAPGRREVAPGTPSSVLLKGKRGGGGLKICFYFFTLRLPKNLGGHGLKFFNLKADQDILVMATCILFFYQKVLPLPGFETASSSAVYDWTTDPFRLDQRKVTVLLFLLFAFF